MGDKDKFEAFFYNRLEQSDLPEEDWMLPSEDVWNVASKHFPKEKKTRKFPFLFFWGVGLVLMIGLATYLMLNQPESGLSDIAGLSVENEDHDIVEADQEVGNTAQPNLNNEEMVATRIADTPENISDQNQEKGTSGSIGERSEESITTSENLSSEHIDHPRHTSDKGSASDKMSTDQPVTNEAILEPSHAPNTRSYLEDNPNPLSTTEINKRESNVSTVEPEQEAEVLPSRYMAIESPLPNVPLALVDESDDLPIKTLRLLNIDTRPFYQWEVGLTHARFITNPFSNIDEADVANLDTYVLTTKYRNVNIPVTYHFDRSWSLASGVQLTTQDVRLDLSISSLFLGTQNINSFGKEISEGVEVGDIEINDTRQDVELRLKPGLDIPDEDIITIRSSIPIRLRAVQIPIFLNYRLNMGRFDLITHAGLSFDLIDFIVDPISLDIVHMDNVITEDFATPEAHSVEFGVSVITGMGFSYSLTDRIGLSSIMRLDLTDLEFTRWESGVYYRF